MPFFPDCHITRDIYRAFYSISAIWSLISICVNPLVIFLAKFTTFYPPDRFSPFPQDSSFSQIDPLTRDISRSLVIFHHICFFQLLCQVLAVFANSPFDQGYLTEHPLHIRRTFCDLSPFLSFSPSLSGFRPFFQIVILPWISLGHSIQFPLFGNFLVRSPVFTLLVRFWHIFPDWLFYQKIFWSLISICVNPFVIFLAKFTTFCPPDRFSPFPQDSSFSQIDPLTRDISRSLVIFHHICFFQLLCQVLAVFANSPFDQGYLTEHPLHIRRTFCDLSPFLSFSPSLSGFRPFFQIVILPWISLGHSIQFPLFGNFLVRSPVFTLLVRFWHIFPDWLFYQKIFWSLISICVNPLVIFLAKFTTFHPPDRFSPFPPDSSF